ncbi:Alpha/Beta hydrolase protein [Paraphoma chrysanthemicola]|uniref:Alpha/Beta hydrolase protein n=1 Tax=Paraphoma chrysanthemicola TaxID=798071 RepID=A0A8K0QRR6_9PLEO|nr:Alpha/Beta hydrolase protein [Paraphoma chrysanthemicola]
MAMPSPTFIFIPGAFCPSTYFEKVTSLLSSQNYKLQALDPPSTDQSLRAQGKTPGLYDDATYVRNIIVKELDAGQDVVLIGSSYGGAVAMEACKGITGSERANAGDKGGQVKHLVLLGTLLCEEGFSVKKDMEGGNMPIDLSTAGIAANPWLEAPPPAMAGAGLCGSLPKDEQERYGAMGKAMSAQTFVEELTFAAWKVVPTTLVVGSKDVPLSPEKQLEFFDKAVGKGEAELKKVVIEGGDHLTMLSHPEEVGKVCLEAAGIRA